MSNYSLILVRHGESQWNEKNLFTGWVDVDLNQKGLGEAARAGELLKESGILPDVLHTSLLRRAIKTANIALDVADRHWIPVHRTWRLNERHYGALQGKDKAQTLAEYGEEQFMLWRRSFDTPPPAIDPNNEFAQTHDPRYADLGKDLPGTECLADVVVRMPTGAGAAAGPFHSQSNEAWFFHTPGLKIVYPAFPGDAKGLLNAAIEDPNPVLFFEHKYLYRSIKEEVSDEYYTLEIGKARTVRAGNNISVITYGLGVHWAIEAAEKHPELDLDIIDLRTLAPLDTQAIYDSVAKTGKVIVLHEDSLTGGIGGEIASLINENCFSALDAPVKRIGSLDTPIPFAADLEQNFLPKQRFIDALIALDNY